MKKTFTRLLATAFCTVLMLFSTQSINAQNALTTLGLTNSTTATNAYSLRKLSSSYTGFAIQVSRSNDNNTQNIGFTTNGDLDTVALKTFVGNNNGFVSIWYDQSGNNNNATNTLASAQPSIVTAGVINRTGSANLPTITTTTSNQSLSFTVNPNITTNTLSVNAVAVMQGATPQYGRLVSLANAYTANDFDNNNFTSAIIRNINNNEVTSYRNLANTSISNFSLNSLARITTIFNGTNNQIFVNGSAGSVSNLSSGSFTISVGRLFNHTFGPEGWVGSASEVIIYSSALNSTDRQSMEASQAAYYNGCTPTPSTFTTNAYGSYKWIRNNQTYTTSGTYTFNYSNAAGCNSTDTLKLTINPYTGCYKEISAGNDHTIAIKNDGTLWAWGNNASVQLGDGTNIRKNTPTQIGVATNWASISAGERHTIAIKTDGTLWAWGDNFYGQLGDGTNTNKNTPTQIGVATNWASISAGESHSLAIKTDGTLWAWGDNFYGQLGDSSNTDKNTPTKIGVATNWASISAGAYHTTALKTDGTAWAWGYNFSGQLGDSSNTDKNTPTKIGVATNWASISAGAYHTTAIKTDGTAWAWGYNFLGQLGDGTNTQRNTPTSVLCLDGPLTTLNIPIKIAAAAYSVRKLAANYAGFAIKVRRSLNNDSLNIGFTPTGDLDTTALKTFVGSGNGFVSTWYDQSGIARNLTQTDTAKQPKIVQAGVIYRRNGKPTVFLDATNDGMLFSGNNYITSNGFSVNLVAGSNSNTSAGRRAIQGSTTTNNWLIGPYNNTHTWFAGGFNHTVTPVWDTSKVERFTVIQSFSNANTSFRNGTAITTANNKTTTPGKLSLGASGGFAEPLDGFISEVVSYSTELNTTDIQSMETSQAAYYTPCTPTPSTFTVAACGSYNWAAKGNKLYTASNTTDTIMLVNAAGCDSIVTLNLTINVGPVISSITPSSVCVGTPITMSVDGTATQVQWQLNGTTVSTNNSLTATAATTSTVAGGNLQGSNANQLSSPTGVFVDAAGSIYVADQSNHRIQKWAVGATTGTTVAGGNGDGSTANQLSSPYGIFVDAAGSIFVADQGNHRIQKFPVGSTTGTTVAGGNGFGSTANQLNFPQGVFVDAAGSIYVADERNHRIQKWAVGATTGTTVAGGNGYGNNANQLYNPYGVFVDAAGSIYVADAINNRIQKWAVGALTGTTVVGGNGDGSGANQLYFPQGVFVDAAGSIYVADLGNHRIQKWAVGALTGTTVAGTGTAGSLANQLSLPYGVFVDAAGSIYVADQSNHRIQKVAAVGKTATFTPTQAGTYTAIVSNGTCTTTSTVVVVKAATTSTFTVAACGSYTWAAKGNKLYTASNTTDTIMLVNAAGCDSIVTLNLTITPAPNTAQSVTAYGSYTWLKNNTTYTTTGTYTTGYTNPTGCAVVDTLKLTINPYAGCFKQVIVGDRHTLAIKNDGTLWAWGYNSNNQLGAGAIGYPYKASPTQVGTDNNWLSVSVGGDHSIALKTDGSLWAWGANNAGQLGDGTSIDKNTPTRIGISNNWASISSRYGITMAIKTDGSLWAWGANNAGQLGDGTSINRHIPTQIGTATNWASISNGSSHSLAIKVDGTLWAWGANNAGQLGDGTNLNRTTPTQIGTANNWAILSPGQQHTTALKTDGTLWAWGMNGWGQLGDGTVTNRNTPTQIGTATNWASISAATFHSLALKNDGSLWASGDNNLGQFGDGTNTNSLIHTQIGTVTNWASISTAGASSMSIQKDGSLKVWGSNLDGQLGDGTINERITPTSIVCPVTCVLTASTFTVTACGSYNWPAKANKLYTASNNTDTIRRTNAAGCDSIVTLNLTITSCPLTTLGINSIVATAAYSLRKLSTSYTGNTIQVRRSSDNTTQNIGFTAAGDLDTTALKTFVGSNNGFVSIWYDQSGNNNNATNTLAAAQPFIVTAGVINRTGSANLPTVTTTSNQALNFAVNPNITTNTLSVNAVAVMQSATPAFGRLVSLANAYTVNDFDNSRFTSVIIRNNNNNEVISYRNLVSTSYGRVSLNSLSRITTIFNGATNQIFVNGSAGFISDLSSGSFAISVGRLFNHTNNADLATGWVGSASEVIIYSSALNSTDRQNMEISQAAYYLNETVLPAQISDVTAQLQTNKTVAVNWKSTTEVNLASYNVQRSTNGNNFETIGTVTAKGLASDYSFVDDKPFVGINYYRLKMVDIDGTFALSAVKTATVKAEMVNVSMYPNPVDDVLNIKITNGNVKQVRVFSTLGKTMYLSTTNRTSHIINVKSFEKGTYFVEIITNESKVVERFLKN